ncbi:hypothetical protein COEREDRAFT_13698 [Coemansia reversa NRRL 1564]|uniref:HMG box domain-containing protein n=1 Tax=Coemansia reversa (strain ATCC 12441 / NRRL 1564) TaxID=763665 RepID=A0A2G5BHY2_COERN|nr:hypothetical protein COEREDRAFT_13698 [Coemansia reversa NRRL 1564]|eukprot:PIA18630.1 hypothetical protein COEREDRAFT_13698 [Coemansia reversa NRRL 1564]
MSLPSHSPSPFQPQLISSQSQVPFISAEYPIVDIGIGEHITSPRPGVTYSRVTVLVPSDRQLIMLPKLAPFETSTIVPVIIPPNRDIYGIENVDNMSRTAFNGAQEGYSEVLSTVYKEPASAGNRSISEILGIPGQIKNTANDSYSSHKGKEVEFSVAQGTTQQQQGREGVNSSASAATTSKSVSDDPEPEEKIKKPSNAFILFRSAYTARHKAENKQAKDISVIASYIWKDMTNEEKRPFLEKGAEERREHNRKKELLNQAAKRRKKMQNKRSRNVTKETRGRSKSDTTAVYSKAKIVTNPAFDLGGGNDSSGGNTSLAQLVPSHFLSEMHIDNHFAHSNHDASVVFSTPTIMTADSSITQPTEPSIASVIDSLPIFSYDSTTASVAALAPAHAPLDSLAQHHYPLQIQTQMGLNQYASHSNQRSWDELSALLSGAQSTAPISSVDRGEVMSPLFDEQNLQQIASSVAVVSQPSHLPHAESSLLRTGVSSLDMPQNSSASADIDIMSAIPAIEVLDTGNQFAFTKYTTSHSQ